MLKKCTLSDFEQYADFAYELAMNPEKCGYHLYYDGIKTKDDFLERGRRSLSKDTEEVLLFILDDTVEGMILYFWEPDNLYLQTIGFTINRETEQALQEFLAYLSERFPGYSAYLGFPAENTGACNYLNSIDCQLIEDDYYVVGHADCMTQKSVHPDITLITKENYHQFESIHRQITEEIYWNCERILEHFDDWTVFVRQKNGIPTGAIYYKHVRDDLYEIFGIEFLGNQYDAEAYKELLNAALCHIKEQEGKHIFYFTDEESLAATISAGFTLVGQYLCWEKQL